jgi:hypothetical protein
MCWSTFGCRRRRFIDLEVHDSSRVCVLQLRSIKSVATDAKEAIAVAELVCRTAISKQFISLSKQRLVQRTKSSCSEEARAFRLDLAGRGAHASRRVCLRPRLSSFQANAQSPPTPTTSTRVGQLVFKYPRAFQPLQYHQPLLSHPYIRPHSIKPKAYPRT